MGWTVEGDGIGLVTTIRIKLERNANWEQWVLLTADRHLDNPHCKRAMVKRHLDQAVERGAFNIDLGDSFCAMQGKTDPRHQKGSVGEGQGVNDYFGTLLRQHFEFFKPYVSVLAVAGLGNHETKIIKHSEIDLTRALVDRLRDNGSKVVRGGYRGWVRCMFESDNGARYSRTIYYDHGSGGGGPVTKGVIQTNRRAAMLCDADIVASGHIHESWVVELQKVGLSAQGVQTVRPQYHVCVPTYKDEFGETVEGFHHEKGAPPKPLGAWWIRFYWDKPELKFELIRAN